MKVLVLYRPMSEHATATEEFLRNLERQHGLEVETIDIDSRDGQEKAKLYDIVQYPAILVVDDFGSVLNIWQGDQLPMIDDVTGYAGS